MNILCLIEDLGPGGAQRQLVNLAIELKKRSYNVTFLTFSKREFYQPILANAKIQVIEQLEQKPFFRIIKLRKIIRSGNYNSVISFLSSANIISTLSAIPFKKWKVIVGERSANPIILKSLKSIAIRQFHFFADYVVANSHANMRMIEQVNPVLSRKKCKVIYNMIDLDTWKPPNGFQFRANDKLKIVVVASHRQLKNLEGLVKALLLLSKEERMKLLIEWYGDRIREPFYDSSFMKSLSVIESNNISDTIRFYPATPRVKEKMEMADVIALFSFFEGLPNTICEGMALGKPILASNVSDVPQLVQANGILIDPCSEQSIARGLSVLLLSHSRDLQRMGEISRRMAVELFDKDKVLEDYICLMK